MKILEKHVEDKIKKKLGWKRMIGLHEYNQIAMSGFKGWDKIKNLVGYNVPTVHLIEVTGSDFSKNLALEFDDISDGNFYYRDITEDGSLWIEEDEEYSSIFVFQFESDMLEFVEMLNKKESVNE